VIRHIMETARSFIFDTGLAPASVAAALASLNVLREEPDRPTRVRDVATTLSFRLKDAGFRVTMPDAAVISLQAPSPEAALQWADECRAAGVWVGCFRPPSVPDKISRLRLTARADLTDADVDRAVEVITRCAPAGAS
jgi:8-amino-7-oxononanoate synthase